MSKTKNKTGFRALSHQAQSGTLQGRLFKGLITGVIAMAILCLLFTAGGCQADGKMQLLSLDWSHKVLRDGEGAESRNTGNCQKVYSWGDAK
jgi:hypothetical protein